MKRRRFIKVQLASIAGSLIDYISTIALVEIFHCWYVFANFVGNAAGGSIQFILLRNWVFKDISGRTRHQIPRFMLIFAGNLILSAIGIYMPRTFLRVNYLVSKTVVSIVLGVSYNYILQKKFVFGPIANYWQSEERHWL